MRACIPPQSVIKYCHKNSQGCINEKSAFSPYSRRASTSAPVRPRLEGREFALQGANPAPVDTAEYDWEWSYGQLEPGNYRFIIEVLSDNDTPITPDSPIYYLSAEFTVSA